MRCVLVEQQLFIAKLQRVHWNKFVVASRPNDNGSEHIVQHSRPSGAGPVQGVGACVWKCRAALAARNHGQHRNVGGFKAERDALSRRVPTLGCDDFGVGVRTSSRAMATDDSRWQRRTSVQLRACLNSLLDLFCRRALGRREGARRARRTAPRRERARRSWRVTQHS